MYVLRYKVTTIHVCAINAHIKSANSVSIIMTIFTIDYCLSDVTDLIVNNTRPGIIHIVRLATGENKTSDNVDIRQLGNALERTIHRALAYISDTHMMHSTRSTANIIDEIRIKAPDVVHINNVHKDYINLPFLAHALIKMQIPTDFHR